MCVTGKQSAAITPCMWRRCSFANGQECRVRSLARRKDARSLHSAQAHPVRASIVQSSRLRAGVDTAAASALTTCPYSACRPIARTFAGRDLENGEASAH